MIDVETLRYLNSTQTKEPRQCLNCGKEYIPFSCIHKFCCVECRIRFYEKQKPRKLGKTLYCAVCGKPFTQTGWNQKFCSEECRLINEKLRYRREREQMPKKPKTVCRFCKSEFESRSVNQIFCHTDCSRKYAKIQERILKLNYDQGKKEKELEKLQKLGRNYRFADQSLNIFYGLTGGENE